MNRVIVIGCPGSGKSVFSRALAAKTGIPLFHLDMMYWNADRTTVDRAVFRGRLDEALKGERWIIDGNYLSTMETRMAACDTVFFLDYPLAVCLEGVRARRGKPRPDMPWIEEGEDAEFIRFIENYALDSRPKVLELLEKYRDREIHIFKTRTEAEDYLSGL
ncbi:MAG: adenylate kinase [Clostridia bacterium]|nr:adenylate kinase [Clostridia bacterium]